MLETERVADRQHPLAHSQGVGVPQRDTGEIAGVDLDDGDVRIRVAPHHLRAELPTVEQPHVEEIESLHDVVVGHDVAVGRDDEAAPAAALRLLGHVLTRVQEEPVEWCRQLGMLLRGARLDALLGLDIDDGWPNHFGNAGERVAEVDHRL